MENPELGSNQTDMGFNISQGQVECLTMEKNLMN